MPNCSLRPCTFISSLSSHASPTSFPSCALRNSRKRDHVVDDDDSVGAFFVAAIDALCVAIEHYARCMLDALSTTFRHCQTLGAPGSPREPLSVSHFPSDDLRQYISGTSTDFPFPFEVGLQRC